MTTIIKDFVSYGFHYVIVKMDDFGGMYGAINKKYIDDAGKTNKELNGLEMCVSRELKETLTKVEQNCRMEYLQACGKTKPEAFAIVFGLKLETAEKLFANN